MGRPSIGAIRLCLFTLFIVFMASGAVARELSTGQQPRIMRPWSREEFLSEDLPDWGLTYAPAQVDTYLTVFYDFEEMDWQGWTTKDLTAQQGLFWHVDDFAGLGGGLTPLEGAKSMWCGARPGGDDYMCT